jgi:hypothetical protein
LGGNVENRNTLSLLVEGNVNEQTDDNEIMHVLTAQKCIGVLDVK